MARDLCAVDSATPCRPTFGFMPEGTEVLMYVLFAVSFVFFVYGFWRKWASYRRGQKKVNVDRVGERFARFFRNSVGQAKTIRKKFAGPMHALIFYGFIVLLIGTILVGIDYDITQPFMDYQFLKGGFYLFFEFALDLGGILFLIGILMAIKRRLWDRPEALESSWQDAAILSTLFIIGITGYVLEALRLAIQEPAWASYSFGAAMMVPLLPDMDPATLSRSYQAIWWTHAVLVFIFIAGIPFTKLHHMVTSAANTFFAPVYDEETPKGKLPTPFNLKEMMESGSFEDVTVGAKRLEDFSWQDLLATDACTVCGRCQDQCPAYAAGRPLSPMRLVLDLRNEMRRKGPPSRNGEAAGNGQGQTKNELVDDVISAETLWSCVTCRACMDACPVDIPHVPLIVEMRRGLVADMKIDKQKSDLLNNLTNTGNAYGLPTADRGKWAQGLEVPVIGQDAPESLEVLYWVGCSGSYDPRNQNVSRSVVKLLKAANVKFAILGPNERCTGDPARRLGEEGRFQELALANAEAIKASGAKRVIAQCPHCFNTLKNEYKEFGLDLTVEHHTQFIDRLIQDGRLKIDNPITDSMTYHEPCYLGRYNDEYESARNMLRVIPNCQMREMDRVREHSFCCGAGGANMWFEVKDEKTRISNLRMAEAMSTGAKRVATACPFCLTMLDDASRVMGGDEPPAIQDVAEILAEAMGGTQAPKPDEAAAMTSEAPEEHATET